MSGRASKSPETSTSLGPLARDVLAGLTGEVRCLPCKYLYDDRGSILFEEITRQPEYYQTRTEEKILEESAADIVARVQPRELVELGSGVGRKVRLLLDAMDDAGLLRSCVLLDINASFLEHSVAELREAYPRIRAQGLHGDFHSELPLLGPGGDRLVILLGGTIGNTHPDEMPAFLGRVGQLLEPGDAFLVGFDLVKDADRLNAAYNDAAGVTAEFNKNLLRMINRELDGDFDLDAFDHVAFYDEVNAWVDIRLRSMRDQSVRLGALDLTLEFSAGEEIRTEISAKYTRDRVAAAARAGGLELDGWYTDAEDLFALALLKRAGR